MTDMGQSREDPRNLIKSPGASLLTPKATLRPGCWNVTWAPEGKRGRGRPRETWRRTMEKERNQLGWHSGEWGAAAASAADRDG